MRDGAAPGRCRRMGRSPRARPCLPRRGWPSADQARGSGDRPIARGHPLGLAWLIEEAGHVIGYTILCLGFGIEYGGPDAFVDDLYLVSQARGRGIGRIVLELLQGEARGQGLAALFLVVDPDNWRARRLYDRAGFEGSNWLLMAKRL